MSTSIERNKREKIGNAERAIARNDNEWLRELALTGISS